MIQRIENKLACCVKCVMIVVALMAVQTVQAGTPADKTALTAAIGEAETYLGTIQESNANEAKVLAIVIDGCKAVLNNADATQTDVDFATETTNGSVNECKMAVTRNALAAAIAKGEEYLDSIRENYPEPAQKMSALIGNCKYFLNNTDSSLEVLEFGILGMEEDTKVIKTEVARIDLAAAIAKGEAYLATIQEKYPEPAQKMSALIGNCKYFLNNTDSSLDVLEFGILGMEEDTKAIKTEVARVDLAAAIAGAEEYLRSIQEGNASVVSVLQTVIATANEMKADESLTLYDLEFATAVVNEVVALSKEAGIPTGVSAARVASRMAAAYYDLSGRRMAQPAKKGVYINNGVKTVVK